MPIGSASDLRIIKRENLMTCLNEQLELRAAKNLFNPLASFLPASFSSGFDFMGDRRKKTMKTFKVILNIGGASYVQAERWERDGEWYKFYRDGYMIAEFAAPWVVKIDERALPPESKESAE